MTFDFRKRKPDNRSRYLRYDDVFISDNGRNKPSYPDEKSYRKLDPESEYEDEAFLEYEDDFDDDYEAPSEKYATQQREHRPSKRDREYFSRQENGILDERMVKYKKRQPPPLQRYGQPQKDMYLDQHPAYWSDHDEYRSRKPQRNSFFGSILQRFIFTFTSILSLVSIAWIFYSWNNDKKTSESIDQSGHLIIEPEQPSFKVLPESPGGTSIPHKDKAVYSQVNPNMSYLPTDEKLLPPEESPLDLPKQPQQYTPQASQIEPVEEYSIIDEKTYYIKISAGKDREILESEAKLLQKKFSGVLADKTCSVKKVSNSKGEQKHAILIGPFDSQSSAIGVAKSIGGQCYVISVKD